MEPSQNKYPRHLKGKALLEAWQEAQAHGMRQADLAQAMGIKYNALTSRLYRAQHEYTARDDAREYFIPDLGEAWTLKGDFVIVGDVHVPYTDPDFAPLVNILGKRWKIPRLLIAGDLFNMDSFSSYAAIVQRPTWAAEREFAKQWLHEALDAFEEIYILMGNHDRRLQKWTAGAFETSDILALITTNERVKISNFGWCVIDTPAGPWRVTHPRNYGINQLSVADALAQKYQMHIISHHEHHLAKGWDRYKNHVIVNNGILADPDKFAYVVLDDSKSAGMTRGFTILRNGTPYLFGDEPFTDWTFLK